MRNILKTAATIAAAILMIDAAGFALWILSSQHPIGNFYIGTITDHILRAIL